MVVSINVELIFIELHYFADLNYTNKKITAVKIKFENIFCVKTLSLIHLFIDVW